MCKGVSSFRDFHKDENLCRAGLYKKVLKLQEEIIYYEGFIISVDNKLSNEIFVQNAKPEVVEKERQKRDDGLAKLNSLKESLSRL